MMMKPLMKVNSFISHCYRVKQNVLTPWFFIIIGDEECGNNFEAGEAFPPIVMGPKDMTNQNVMGFNDDDVLAHVNNVDQMVRDAKFKVCTQLLK